MFKIKFTTTYDGRDYHGWQRQSIHSTVQGTIEAAFTRLFSLYIPITGSGRTDRGVHALGQICSCKLPKEVDLKKLRKSLNAILPADIRILTIDTAEESFHPRYLAKGKIYRYNVYTGQTLNPFYRHTWHYHPYPLDISLIKEARDLFLGEQDFTSFANLRGKDSPETSSVRTIYTIDIEEHPHGISFLFHGNGFLYKMIRNITGALIDVGEGKVSLEEIKQVLKKKDNRHNLRQVPALGLCLESVIY